MFRKTIYSEYIYIIKQDICIYINVAYSRSNGWTDWAEFFCRHSWVAGGCNRFKKFDFLQFFFSKFEFFFSRAMSGLSASIYIN